jgi:hypothetical protein
VEVRRDTLPRDLEKQLQWKKSEWEDAVAREIMDQSSTYSGVPAGLPCQPKPYYYRFIPSPPHMPSMPSMPSLSMRMPRWLKRSKVRGLDISAPTLVSGPMAPTSRITAPHPLRLHSVLFDRSTQTSPGPLLLPEFDFPIPPPSIRSSSVYRNTFRTSVGPSPITPAFPERSPRDWPLPLFRADGRPHEGEARLADVRRKSTMVRASQGDRKSMTMQRVEINSNPYVNVDRNRLVARDERNLKRLSRSTTSSRATTVTDRDGYARGF